MQQSSLHNRHRNKDGDISRKHGNTLVSTLRKIYGPSFAPDAKPGETLSEVLAELDEPSLTSLVHDHQRGALEEKNRGSIAVRRRLAFLVPSQQRCLR